MPVRARFRVGRDLIEDEEIGFIQYDDKIVKREYDGIFVKRGKQDETRHPQEFVRAGNDPRGMLVTNGETVLAEPNCGTLYTYTITGSDSIVYSILAPEGPGFPFDKGISDDGILVSARSAQIECTFAVRADNELQSGDPVP